MQQYLQNKKGLVQSVFDRVYNKYDLKYFKQMTLHSIIIAGYYTGSVLPILKKNLQSLKLKSSF